MKSQVLCLCLGATVWAFVGAACSSGKVSDPCQDGQVIDGVCVPNDCPDQDCPEGFACYQGVCTDLACVGVICDPGSTCASGACYPSDCIWRNCPGVGEVCVDEECQPASCVGVECPDGQQCAAGICYPKDCQTRNCPGYGEVCIHEECVDRTCVGVTCPEGQRCAGGYCYPAGCGEVGCFSDGEVCVDGVCVRASCVDVECAEGLVCANGYCYPVDCGQQSCSAYGEVCVEGVCLPADCVGVECGPGERCARGECLPIDCNGLQCPAGAVCYEGVCVADICVGMGCPPGQRCADGECLPTDCQPGLGDCGQGEVCAQGACVPADCAHVQCAAGEACGADGGCYPADCAGVACGPFELCVAGVCTDQLCVGVTCEGDTQCAGGACYPTDCDGQACPAGQVCIDGACTGTECAACRCCPDVECSLNNQCQAVQCCGQTQTCLFDAQRGLPVWSEAGTSCSDGDPCTGPDSCGGDTCVGVPVVCDDPPANFCDGVTRHVFPPEGVCSSGVCEYPAVIEDCAIACEAGQCVGVECDGGRCDPGEECVSGACSCSGTGPDCSGGETCCSGDCAVLDSDPDHCGACGFACNDNATCQAGRCSCSAPYGNCDGDWDTGCEVDTRSSPLHCGGCGQPCPAGLHADVECVGGDCTYTCQGTWLDCDDDERTCEADGAVNVNHCGVCGFACGPNASCVDGQCACDTGFSDCNADWGDGCEVDHLNDVANCGGCGGACVGDGHNDVTCVDGGCVFVCLDPWLDCDADPSTCEVDSAVDENNCGGCGNTCGPDAHCGDKQCACDAGRGNCNADWGDGCETDTTSSMAHCGGCDQACQLDHASENCTGGACLITGCDANYDDCNGLDPDGCEAYLPNDENNCGVCGNDCGQRAHCAAGVCECDAGYGNCDGSWGNGCETDILTSMSHCGGCNQGCSLAHASETCTGGNCVITACDSTYYDPNGNDADGCECRDASDTPNTCNAATSLGTVGPGVTRNGSGRLVNEPGGYHDVDCFSIQLNDPAGTCTLSLSIAPVGQIVFDGYRDTCASAYCQDHTALDSACSGGRACENGGNTGTYTICVKAANPNTALCLDYTVSATCN